MAAPFETKQKSYYTREINRGIPTVGGPAPGDVAAAVVTDHAGFGASAASFLADFGSSTQVIQQADIACRGLPYPGSGMRDPGARTGCGWWFVSDTSRPSTGALGTRRGPMSPTLDTQYGPGQWMWDPAQAEAYELMKRASTIRTCTDLVNSGDSMYGWCRTTNRAVPLDATGAPRYSTAAGGDCPGNDLVMVSDGVAACSSAAAVPGTTAPATPTSACGSGTGPLPPACLAETLTQYQGKAICTSGGSLVQKHLGGSYVQEGDAVSRLNDVMSRQFSLNLNTYQTGNATVQQVMNDSASLANFANSGTGRAAAAARDLCFSAGSFDICSYTSSDPGPFDLGCIRQVALSYGYAANAGLLTLGNDYWNNATTFPNWGAVLNNLNWWKSVADQPPGPNNSANLLTSTSPDAIQKAYQLQRTAMNNVYGISLPAVQLACSA
jgi:hypothetical protein